MKDLNKTIRRSQQYWFDDGLVELLLGLLFLVLSGLFWWQVVSDSEYAPLVGGIAMPFIIILGSILMGVALRWLKQRPVYPRTGYVTYVKPTNRQRGMSGLLGLIIGIVMAVAVTQFELAKLTAAFIGAGLGFGLFLIGNHMGVLRFHLLAIWAVASGVLITFLGVDESLAATLALGLVGLGMMLSGGFAFWRYWQNSEPGNDEPMEALS
ncbi:hypothetical protein [Candidatus Leptofilum sp.]|uniref:hypothetical protein n=1 Tax=Candidatus Leptofilum sp. TaxID=3241576 RepID=UPI003B5CC1D3